jgi:hypothetical protein
MRLIASKITDEKWRYKNKELNFRAKYIKVCRAIGSMKTAKETCL